MAGRKALLIISNNLAKRKRIKTSKQTKKKRSLSPVLARKRRIAKMNKENDRQTKSPNV